MKSYQEGGASGPHLLRLLQGHALTSVQCIYTTYFTKSMDVAKYDSVPDTCCFNAIKKTGIDLTVLFTVNKIHKPRQAILCLRAFRHDKFQLRMPSHSEGPGIWLSV